MRCSDSPALTADDQGRRLALVGRVEIHAWSSSTEASVEQDLDGPQSGSDVVMLAGRERQQPIEQNGSVLGAIADQLREFPGPCSTAAGVS